MTLPAVQGRGVPQGAQRDVCPMCRGKANILRSSQAGPFRQRIRMPCPACDGTGARSTSTCAHCGGAGRWKERFAVQLRIPAGTDTGALSPLMCFLGCVPLINCLRCKEASRH